MLNSKSIHKGWVGLFDELKEYNVKYLVVLDHFNEDTFTFLQDELSCNFELDYLIVARRGLKVAPIIDNLTSESRLRTYFYFPLHLKKDDPFYETNWVNKKLLSFKTKYPKLSIKPYPGIDVYDPRINPELNLEPYILPNVSYSLPNNRLKISVVIPTYNFKNYIANTVRHLLDQDLPNNEYEIIVVDDGSTDGSEEFVLDHLKDRLENHNFKYIYFPRPGERRMGDGNFRAGIARNLGVKHSSGEYLCFLDSDIITPKNFLSSLYEQHKSADVIQTRRHYLTKVVSNVETNYEDINMDTDTFIPEGGYWHNFYNNPVPWHERPTPWKFVCTYSLSLKREFFVNCGSFKKNYHFYGFEDTCLGLRSYKNNKKLHLSDLIVYHLFHADERSEYKNSDVHRAILLKKTAKIFFHNHLEPEIYTTLGGLVVPPMTMYGLKRSLQNHRQREK